MALSIQSVNLVASNSTESDDLLDAMHNSTTIDITVGTTVVPCLVSSSVEYAGAGFPAYFSLSAA